MGARVLSVLFTCVGSGDPVRVLRLYTIKKYTGYTLKHLLLRHMYNLPLPILLCHAQALCSETSSCYDCMCVTLCVCTLNESQSVSVCVSCTVLCSALYTACVEASRMVFWDRSNRYGWLCWSQFTQFLCFLLSWGICYIRLRCRM